MLKKISAVLLFIIITNTSFASPETLAPEVTPNSPTNTLYKFKVSTINEIEYWWILHNDGCFRLYKVVIVDGILEFWTALGWSNYIGPTTNCIYTKDQMETMC